MEFLAKNTSVSVKILTGWVVRLLRYREPTASSGLTNQNSLKSVQKPGRRSWGVRPHETTCTQITPVVYDENKYRHSAKDMCSERI